jgi:hypothetical protein
VCLHNFLRSQNSCANDIKCDYEDLETETIIPGEWRDGSQHFGFLPLRGFKGNRNSDDARKVREEFCTYFNEIYVLPWQNK